jgi:hypothetical protein
MRDGGCCCLRRRAYRISTTSGDSNIHLTFIGVIASAVTDAGEVRAPLVQVVLNWFGGVKRRMQAN